MGTGSEAGTTALTIFSVWCGRQYLIESNELDRNAADVSGGTFVMSLTG